MLQKTRRSRILAVLCLSVWLVIAGCSSSKSEDSASGSVGMKESSSAVEAPQAAAKKLTTTSADFTVSNQTQKGVAGAGQGLEGTKGFSAVNTAESWDRKVIYKGNLTMEVPDYTAAQTEINNLVTLASGYILQFSENQSTSEKSGNYVIKVPANGFSSFIRDLEKIKTVSDIRHNIQGQDVSEEYVDLASRLKAKQVVEARLLAFMEKATKTDELLAFSNELGNIQETIEQIKGRMRFLDQNVAMSTVEIRLYEQGTAKLKTAVGDSTLTKTKNALIGSMHALKVIAQGLIVFVAAVLPVIIVFAIIGIPLILILRKRARKVALNPAPSANYTQKIDTTEDQSQDSV
ncbi:MAG: DUF4349 domain-containing protein [Paenibacillaceae bacterium]